MLTGLYLSALVLHVYSAPDCPACLNVSSNASPVPSTAMVFPANPQIPDCTTVTFDRHNLERLVNGALRIKTGYDPGRSFSDYSQAPPGDTIDFCLPLSPQLLHCNLTRLPKLAYHIENHTLFQDQQFRAMLGDYYVDSDGSAWVCNETIDPVLPFPRCRHLVLKAGDYSFLRSDALYVRAVNTIVDRPQYTLDNRTGVANVCVPLSIRLLNCRPDQLQQTIPLFYRIDANLRLYYPIYENAFDLRDYYLSSDFNDVFICVPDESLAAREIPTKVFYAADGLCSALLILAFLYKFVVPNFRPSSLLGFLFSMVVFNVIVVHLKFFLKGYHDLVHCYGWFFGAYFSLMAAICWLTTLAHYVGQQSSKKRHFLCYSVYAWGIPMVQCAIIAVLDFCPMVSKVYLLVPHISAVCWFHNWMSLAVFFHGPIAVQFCITALFFHKAIKNFRRYKDDDSTKPRDDRRRRQLSVIGVKLFVVMVVAWTVDGLLWGLISMIRFPVWYLWDVKIGLESAAIFVVIVWRRRTYWLLRIQMQRMSTRWRQQWRQRGSERKWSSDLPMNHHMARPTIRPSSNWIS